MAKKKLFQTFIQVEVLSEEKYTETDLETIAEDITHGHCSGLVKIISSKVLTGKKAADATIAQGSDVEFFQMDEKGNISEDEIW